MRSFINRIRQTLIKIIYLSQVRIYWDNLGEEKDVHCLVAFVDNKIVGAVWVRTFQGEFRVIQSVKFRKIPI